eukprot:6185523-Pleurochrysis_carterae.AAC.2
MAFRSSLLVAAQVLLSCYEIRHVMRSRQSRTAEVKSGKIEDSPAVLTHCWRLICESAFPFHKLYNCHGASESVVLHLICRTSTSESYVLIQIATNLYESTARSLTVACKPTSPHRDHLQDDQGACHPYPFYLLSFGFWCLKSTL